MLATDEKSNKADFGPGETEVNVKGKGVLVSNSVVSEQGKKNVGKYPKVASLEEIMEEFKCFAPDAHDVVNERVNEFCEVNSYCGECFDGGSPGGGFR